jgi:hypothetical protein
MAQRPIDPNGGETTVVATRLLTPTLHGVALAAAGDSITISEWIRNLIEAELMRRDIELAQAIGQPLLPVPDRGAAPPGGAAA